MRLKKRFFGLRLAPQAPDQRQNQDGFGGSWVIGPFDFAPEGIAEGDAPLRRLRSSRSLKARAPCRACIASRCQGREGPFDFAEGEASGRAPCRASTPRSRIGKPPSGPIASEWTLLAGRPRPPFSPCAAKEAAARVLQGTDLTPAAPSGRKLLPGQARCHKGKRATTGGMGTLCQRGEDNPEHSDRQLLGSMEYPKVFLTKFT